MAVLDIYKMDDKGQMYIDFDSLAVIVSVEFADVVKKSIRSVDGLKVLEFNDMEYMVKLIVKNDGWIYFFSYFKSIKQTDVDKVLISDFERLKGMIV